MGKKRAHIDATLSATRSSGLFTQDVGDTQPPEGFTGASEVEEEFKTFRLAGEILKEAETEKFFAYVLTTLSDTGAVVEVKILSPKETDDGRMAGHIGYLADIEVLQATKSGIPIPDTYRLVSVNAVRKSRKSNVGDADSSPSKPADVPKPTPEPTDAPEGQPAAEKQASERPTLPASTKTKTTAGNGMKRETSDGTPSEPGSGKLDTSVSASTKLVLFKNKETSKGVPYQWCEFDSGKGGVVEVVNRHKSLMPLLTVALDKPCDIWFHVNKQGKNELDDIIAIDGVRYEKGKKLAPTAEQLGFVTEPEVEEVF